MVAKREKAKNYPSPAKVKQLADAVKETGLKVGAVEISPDGTIRFMSDKVALASPSSAYDDWKNSGG